jgi:ribonuclease HII
MKATKVLLTLGGITYTGAARAASFVDVSKLTHHHTSALQRHHRHNQQRLTHHPRQPSPSQSTIISLQAKRNNSGNKRKKEQSLDSLLALETDLHSRGYQFVIGSDDSGGAGCIAGPVVVASCCLLQPFSAVLPLDVSTKQSTAADKLLSQSEMEIMAIVNDSKTLTPQQRIDVYNVICAHPDVFAVSVAQRSPQEIDDINLTRATQLGELHAQEMLCHCKMCIRTHMLFSLHLLLKTQHLQNRLKVL